jgi:hypothetical protein
MKYSLDQFKNEIAETFSLNYLKQERTPIDCGQYNFTSFPAERVNHLLIKSNDSNKYIYDGVSSGDLRRFINTVLAFCNQNGLITHNRYCYLTIDRGLVETGMTLRNPGYHIDGMQGAEVPVKMPADFQFIWSDCLPTKFSSQSYETDTIDPSIHNVFTHLEKQTHGNSILETKGHHIYAMNAYHVHKATEAERTIYRKFIRISFTNTPITSTKMTLNKNMAYNYPYHTTSGNIPTHLK